MRVYLALIAAFVGLAIFFWAGCGNEPERVSNSNYLLELLDRTWDNALQSLRSGNPNLDFIRSLDILLATRLVRRMNKDYEGADKEQAIAKLEALRDAFQAKVVSLVDLSAPTATLRPGVTIEQVRFAFEKLIPDYQAFQALVGAQK